MEPLKDVSRMIRRLAINQQTTYSWTFEEDLEAYAQAGLAGVGIWRAKLTDFGVEKGGELIRDHNLRVSSLHWCGGFTGSDGRPYDDSLRDGAEALETAAVIESPCLIVHSGARAGHTWRHARRLFRNALEQLLPIAEREHVAMAIEPMHPACAAPWTLVDSLDEAAQLLEEFSSPFLQMVYDLYHFPHPGPELLERLLPHLALVQLADARRPPLGEEPNRCLLGDGQVPLSSRISELEAMGYTGFYEVELRGEDVEGLSYQELVERSVAAFNQLT